MIKEETNFTETTSVSCGICSLDGKNFQPYFKATTVIASARAAEGQRQEGDWLYFEFSCGCVHKVFIYFKKLGIAFGWFRRHLLDFFPSCIIIPIINNILTTIVSDYLLLKRVNEILS